MLFSQKIKPEWVLRIMLGVMYIYSGFGLLANPDEWLGFAPQWFVRGVEAIMPFSSYLRFQGFIEIFFVIAFFVPFIPKKYTRVAALLSTLEIVGILVLGGIDVITFRDIGLLGASFTLFLLLNNRNEGIKKSELIV